MVRIGIHGSKKQACGEALFCSSAVAQSQASLRTEVRATRAPTMPNVVKGMLDYAFRCFPNASPDSDVWGGEATNPQRTVRRH